MGNRIIGAAVLSLAISTVAAAAEQAQSYPSKPVRMLVGFAPGGGVDQSARILAATPTGRP